MLKNYEEDLLNQYKQISNALNYCQNRWALADTEEEAQQWEKDINSLEIEYKEVSYKLNHLYDEL